MRVEMQTDRVTIYVGDSADLDLPANSVDAIVCDPPSGIAFMGKSWDKDHGGRDGWIAWLARTIAPAFAALKPGGHGLFWALPRTSHWTATALELAGFEIRDRVTHLFGCLTADVDVLTPTGWKRGIDVAVGEQVAQWDPATGAISLAPVERVYRAPWSGDLVRFKNADTDQALTPNHRVVHRSGLWKRWSEYRVAEADQVSRRSPCRLPLAGLHDGPGIGGEDYAALLGWVWTEGGFDKTGSGVRVYQSSVNAPKVDEIDALLDRLGAHSRYSYDRTHESRHRGAIEYQAVTWYFSGDLAERVRRDLPGKHPTFDLLWRMSLAEKRAFLRAALLGDGSLTKPILDKRTGKVRRGGAWSLEQKHAGDRAWFVTLLALVGWRGHDYARKARDGGSVSVTQHADTTISAGCLRDDREHYVGEVWCVGVPTGAFVARRKGQVFITGNSGFPKSLNVSKAIDKHLGAEREIVGTHAIPGAQMQEMSAGGKPGNAWTGIKLGGPVTNEAVAWDGWGTALKPAAEDWWLVRKPLGGTVAACVLAHGTGALNIDASRIGSAGGGTSCSNRDEAGKCLGHANAGQSTSGETFHGPDTSGGRWPSHVVFSHTDACELVGRAEGEHVVRVGAGLNPDSRGLAFGMRTQATTTTTTTTDVYRCAPGCAVAELDRQSGTSVSSGRPRNNGAFKSVAKGAEAARIGMSVHSDSGGASRFFYCAKPSKAETEAGLDDLPGKRKNTHPTKKSVALMRYLIRLITPPGGVVLDPFAGSGTTGIAALAEGMRFIGCEQGGDGEEYVPILLGRIGHALQRHG